MAITLRGFLRFPFNGGRGIKGDQVEIDTETLETDSSDPPKLRLKASLAAKLANLAAALDAEIGTEWRTGGTGGQRSFGDGSGEIAPWAEGDNTDAFPLAKVDGAQQSTQAPMRIRWSGTQAGLNATHFQTGQDGRGNTKDGALAPVSIAISEFLGIWIGTAEANITDIEEGGTSVLGNLFANVAAGEPLTVDGTAGTVFRTTAAVQTNLWALRRFRAALTPVHFGDVIDARIKSDVSEVFDDVGIEGNRITFSRFDDGNPKVIDVPTATGAARTRVGLLTSVTIAAATARRITLTEDVEAVNNYQVELTDDDTGATIRFPVISGEAIIAKPNLASTPASYRNSMLDSILTTRLNVPASGFGHQPVDRWNLLKGTSNRELFIVNTANSDGALTVEVWKYPRTGAQGEGGGGAATDWIEFRTMRQLYRLTTTNVNPGIVNLGDPVAADHALNGYQQWTTRPDNWDTAMNATDATNTHCWVMQAYQVRTRGGGWINTFVYDVFLHSFFVAPGTGSQRAFGSGDGEIAAWAEGDNTDDIPLSKIPIGVLQTQAEVRVRWNTVTSWTTTGVVVSETAMNIDIPDAPAGATFLEFLVRIDTSDELRDILLDGRDHSVLFPNAPTAFMLNNVLYQHYVTPVLDAATRAVLSAGTLQIRLAANTHDQHIAYLFEEYLMVDPLVAGITLRDETVTTISSAGVETDLTVPASWRQSGDAQVNALHAITLAEFNTSALTGAAANPGNAFDGDASTSVSLSAGSNVVRGQIPRDIYGGRVVLDITPATSVSITLEFHDGGVFAGSVLTGAITDAGEHGFEAPKARWNRVIVRATAFSGGAATLRGVRALDSGSALPQDLSALATTDALAAETTARQDADAALGLRIEGAGVPTPDETLFRFLRERTRVDTHFNMNTTFQYNASNPVGNGFFTPAIPDGELATVHRIEFQVFAGQIAGIELQWRVLVSVNEGVNDRTYQDKLLWWGDPATDLVEASNLTFLRRLGTRNEYITRPFHYRPTTSHSVAQFNIASLVLAHESAPVDAEWGQPVVWHVPDESHAAAPPHFQPWEMSQIKHGDGATAVESVTLGMDLEFQMTERLTTGYGMSVSALSRFTAVTTAATHTLRGRALSTDSWTTLATSSPDAIGTDTLTAILTKAQRGFTEFELVVEAASGQMVSVDAQQIFAKIVAVTDDAIPATNPSDVLAPTQKAVADYVGGQIEGVKVYYWDGDTEAIPDLDAAGRANVAQVGVDNRDRITRLIFGENPVESYFSDFTVTRLTSAQAEASNIDQVGAEVVPAGHIFRVGPGIYGVEVAARFLGIDDRHGRQVAAIAFVMSNSDDVAADAEPSQSGGNNTQNTNPLLATASETGTFRLRLPFFEVATNETAEFYSIFGTGGRAIRMSAIMTITKYRS